MPPGEKNICPEYISKRNFNTKNQIVLLKITDESEKWHFLGLPNIQYEDDKKTYEKLI